MPDFGDQETTLEKLIRKSTSEPLVPIGCVVTVGFLVRGLRAFRDGQSNTSQMMMRGRIAAQAFTIGALVIGAYAGLKPHDRPLNMEEKIQRLTTKEKE